MLKFIKQLPEELIDYLRLKLRRMEVKRGQHLLEIGQISNKVFFVEKGLFRGYTAEYKNRDHSIWFMKKGDVMFAVRSLYDQVPSLEGILAIEEGIVYYIMAEELEYIYERWPEFNLHGRILTQKYYSKSYHEKERLRMISPNERYRDYLKEEPELEKRVPGKHLASFLGMSTETLYRVRSEEKKRGEKKFGAQK